jgi:hypothetical protein
MSSPGVDVAVLMLVVVLLAPPVTIDWSLRPDSPGEVAVAEQTPMPDDERPVVGIDPAAPGDEPVPDDERPVPDSADVGLGAGPVPDDERPVPDDDEQESR